MYSIFFFFARFNNPIRIDKEIERKTEKSKEK